MQEQSRYVVGIDIGTTTVRCVVGHVDGASGVPKIVGVGEAPNNGMRKGTISHLTGPAMAIDAALELAERMSGHQVDTAMMSVNGSHIMSTKADGMIAVGSQDHEVTEEDLARLEEVATTGKVPPNRDILEVVPHSYMLDGQDNIKDPVGMSGTRLEISANIVSGLAPHIANVQKAAEMAKVRASTVVPAVLASAQATVSEAQMEHGVAVIDLGGATTGVAVFEEGDLQFVSVIPMGGINITNDLAIGLKVDPEVAEVVKLAHGRLMADGDAGRVTVTHQGQEYTFSQQDIDEIIDARCEELFEAVAKELKRAGLFGKLPSGVLLTGGSAQLKGMVDYAKQHLGVAARIGKSTGYAGVSEQADGPAFAAAVGLMLMDSAAVLHAPKQGGSGKANVAMQKAGGFMSKLISKFK